MEKTVPAPDVSPGNNIELMLSENEFSDDEFSDDESQISETDDNSDEDPTVFGPSIDKVDMNYAKNADDNSGVPKKRSVKT